MGLEKDFTCAWEFRLNSEMYFLSAVILISLCSVSSLAWFMSNQENSFVTIGQRLLANPLK